MMCSNCFKVISDHEYTEESKDGNTIVCHECSIKLSNLYREIQLCKKLYEDEE